MQKQGRIDWRLSGRLPPAGSKGRRKIISDFLYQRRLCSAKLFLWQPPKGEPSMHFMRRVTIVAVAAMAIVACAGAAMAHGSNENATGMLVPESQSYTGAWPVTITHSQRSNGTGCLTLNGNANGGSASLVFGSQKYQDGSFLVINDILVATIQEPLYGQNGALMFVASAHRGHIGQGIFENVEGGSNFDAGALAFGMKNGC
jgi:hypothetical protein